MLDMLTGLEILMLTIYGEARGESINGQVAVANVIRNRVKKQNKTSTNLGKTYRDVCLKKWQFSCWNENDANRIILDKIINSWDSTIDIKDATLKQCYWIARGIYNDYLKTNVGKADHYMTNFLYKNNPPSWAKNMRIVTVVDNHIFLQS